MNFSAIFLHRLIAQGLRQFVLSFWAKILRVSRGSCKLNTRWYEILAFFAQHLVLFRKGTRYGHSYNGIMEDEQELVCDLSNGANFNDLE